MKAYPGRVLILSQIVWAAVSQQQQPAYLSLHIAHLSHLSATDATQKALQGLGVGLDWMYGSAGTPS